MAQDMIVFPNNGQSQSQQDKDRGECHVWAVNQTGFDPATASTPTVVPQAAKGGLLRGAARGAVAGVVIGAITGDAGQGAAVGATAGGLGGAMRRKDQHHDMAAQQQNLQAQQDAKQATYQRALTACLEGKGYTVK